MKIKEIFLHIIRKYFVPNRYALKKYLIEDGKEHPFAIICPGGGYGMVCDYSEGKPIAEELNKKGYHAFVVFYRVRKKAKYPNPHKDLQKAITTIFYNAKKWKLDTQNWSLWGSSAGGHLVASYCMEDFKTPLPNALILCYPVITLGKYTHIGTRVNLLGKHASIAMRDKLSVEKHITPNYPPTYAWYGSIDDIVDPINSIMLDEALTRARVIHRVEKYEGMNHGGGLNKGSVAEAWFNNAINFWQRQIY